MTNDDTTAFRQDGGQILLRGTTCTKCSFSWFPAISYGCERCGAHGSDLQARDLKASGTIYSLTEAPDYKGGHFTLVQVILDEGPDISGILHPDSAGRATIGDIVEAVPGDEDEITFQVAGA